MKKKKAFVALTAAAGVGLLVSLMAPMAAYADDAVTPSPTDDASSATPAAPAPTATPSVSAPTATPSATAPTAPASSTPASSALAPTASAAFATPSVPDALAAPADAVYKKLALAAQTADGLSLSNGVLLSPPDGTVQIGFDTTPAAPFNDNILVIDGTYPSGIGPRVSLAYQIDMLGKPSGYWIRADVAGNEDAPTASCSLVYGEPGAGGVPPSSSPFLCSFDYFRTFPNAGVKLDVALNKAAEAGAVINTQGSISLVGGDYSENLLPYHVDGSATVAQNSSTASDVILRDGDEGIVPNLAKTQFIYRIADAGTARTFWIMGYSQNYRGTTKFTGESDCAVYDRDPNTTPGGVDALTSVTVSPYTCTQASWQFVNGDRGDYEATFTVAKRVMQQVTNHQEQVQLLGEFCGDQQAGNCGVSLATVQDTYGPGHPVSDVVNNTGDINDTLQLATSNSQKVTIGGGWEVDVEGGYETLGWSFKTTLKVNFQRSVANVTKTTQTVGITIPPHSRGWIDGSAPMVHTEGEIIVRDGDRYFELTNVVADFPDTTDGHAAWSYTSRSEKLPPSSLGGALGAGGTSGSTTAALPLTPAESAVTAPSGVTQGTGRNALAETGSSVDGTPFLLGLLAIAAGTAVTIVRRIRHRAR